MVNDLLLKKYKGKKVFITGHTGFKGAWLSFLLDKFSVVVKGYSLAPNTMPSLYSSLVFSEKHQSVIGDINDFHKLKKEIEEFKPDFIFHLAAQPLVIESYDNPFYTFQTNFTGTLNLLETLRKIDFSCTAIFITTDKVYENLETNIAFKESDKLGGWDPYSASKSSSELLIQSYKKSFFEISKVRIASARAGNVIGGGDWSKNRLIPDIIRSYKKKERLEIRNPEATRPWQHVLEPLLGYLRLGIKLSEDICFSEAWNFGPSTDDVKSVFEVYTIAKEEGFDVNLLVSQSLKYKEAQFLKLDIAKSKRRLDWIPKWNSATAIKKTMSWYLMFYEGVSPSLLLTKDIQSYLNKE